MFFPQLGFVLRILTFASLVGGVCEPGTVVYAPFPGLEASVQATVVSLIIDGSFVVQWTGSPDLCVHPSNRAKCVVDATLSYNSRGEFCAFRSTTPEPYQSTTSIKVEPTSEGDFAEAVISPGVGIGLALGAIVGVTALAISLALAFRGLRRKSQISEEDFVPDEPEPEPTRKPPFKLTFSLARPSVPGAVAP